MGGAWRGSGGLVCVGRYIFEARVQQLKPCWIANKGSVRLGFL